MNSTHRAFGWCCLTAALVLLCNTSRFAWADGPLEWRFTLQADQKLPLPDEFVQSYVILPKGEPPAVVLLRRDAEAGRLRLDFGEEKRVALRHQRGMVISRDGSTVVQRGEKPEDEALAPVHFHWIWSNGAQFTRAVGPFTRSTLTTMSEDGHLGVADSGGSGGVRIRVYDTKGSTSLEADLPPGGRVLALDVLPGGAGVLVLVSDPDDPLLDHQLYVVKRGAIAPKQLPLGKDGMRIRVVQQRVVLGTGPEVFVQGLDHVGVVNYDTAKVKWIKKRRLRLVSRFAARPGPDGTDTLLIVHGRRNRNSGKSTWFLEAIDNGVGSKGNTLGPGKDGRGSIRLGGEYRATGEHVFESVDGNLIRLIAGMRRIAYSYVRGKDSR